MKRLPIILLTCLLLALTGCGQGGMSTEGNKLIAIASPGANDGSNLNAMTDRLAELCIEGGFRVHYEMSGNAGAAQNGQLKNMVAEHTSAVVLAWTDDAEAACFAACKALSASGTPVILMDLDAAEADPEAEAQRLYAEVLEAVSENN